MKIKEFRERAGMTKTQLADAMNVDLSAVLKWETGVNRPTAARLIQLADLFGCTLDALCGREPPDAGRAS